MRYHREAILTVIFLATSYGFLMYLLNDGDAFVQESRLHQPRMVDRMTDKNATGTVYSDQNRLQSDIQNGDINLDISVPSVEELYNRTALVTGFSNNHFKEALAHIASVQKWMPDKKSIIYDLGMSNGILEKMMLKEFGAVFWGDASQRFKISVKELLPLAATNYSGYMSLWRRFQVPKNAQGPEGKGHGHQYYLTVPKMFRYFGVNRTEYYWSDQAPYPEAGQVLLINSTKLQEKLVQPMVECALKRECIAPPGSNLGNHRFDSSVLNLVIYKNLRYEWRPDHCGLDLFNSVSYVDRSQAGWEKAKYCG